MTLVQIGTPARLVHRALAPELRARIYYASHLDRDGGERMAAVPFGRAAASGCGVVHGGALLADVFTRGGGF